MLGRAGDLGLLLHLGRNLERRARAGREITVRDWLTGGLLKIRTKDRGLMNLEPNRAQREFASRFTNRNIVLKARQLGITSYVAARFFVQTITQPGTMTVQVAHDQESAEEIFKIVHRFWENLPMSLRNGALQTSRANIRQIAFSRLDSEYRVATAADANAGRGMTIHQLHCSEVARWPGAAEETLTSLRAAVPEAGAVVLESTPNGAGGVFYEEWQKAEETGYTRHFFPWWYEEAYRLEIGTETNALTAEEQELADRVGLSHEQIAWRRAKRTQLRGGLAAQEYAEDAISCFRASGECVFDLGAIERAQPICGNPVEVHDNQRLRVWFPPQTGKDYVIGVDPAGGGSDGDYSCAIVIERESALQCAELHGHFPPRELATKLIALGNRYNGALLAVERNNHGHAVLAHLRMAEYPHIFCEGQQDGWLTSAVSRPAMIENLASVLATKPALFQSQQLLTEFRTFVRHADGSTAATSGAHDDRVMAIAIALAVRQTAVGRLRRPTQLATAALAMHR